MDSVNKFFLLAAGLIVTASLIFVGFRMADAARSVGNDMINQFIEFGITLDEAEYMQYDGTSVRGSDVVNFIRKELSAYDVGEMSPIEIVVKTDTIVTHKDNRSVSDVVNFSHMSYISPTGRFHGKVNRNENGVICSVTFIQE